MSLSLNGSGGIFGLDQGLNVTGVGTFQTLNVTGNLTVDGVLTYDDVTNIDSIGVVTARSGLHVTGGSVGIGTDNPICKLVVNSGNTNLATQIVSDDAEVFLAFKDGDSTGNQQVQIGGVGNNFVAYAGGNERLRITSAGGVLIGGHTSAVDVGNAPNIEIVNTSTSTLTLARNDTSIASGNDIAAIRVWGNDSNGTYQQCAEILAEADGDHGTGDKPTALAFKVTADGASSPTERLRITSGGDVGIGTNDPDNKLHIHTDSATAYSDSTNNTSNLTNALLKLENTNGTDDTGVNNYVGIQFSVASGASSTAQLQYVRTGNNSGSFELKARNASSTYPNLVSIGSSGAVTLPAQERFRARKQTTQGGTDNNSLWVTFASSNGTIDYDTHSGFSESNDWYEIQNDGYFMIYASVLITSDTANSLRDYQMAICDSAGGTNTALAAFTARASTSSDDDTHSMQATFLGNLTAGARIRLRAYGNTDTGNYTILDDINDGIGGAGLDVSSLSDKATHFTVVKLG